MNDSTEYEIVAEHYRPHIKAASMQQYMNLAGGKVPSPSVLDHIVEQVMNTIKLEVERAQDLKQKPDLAIPKILASIKATIAAEMTVKKP
jgi:hypothetical protein